MVIKFHAMKDMKILWKILEIYYNFSQFHFWHHLYCSNFHETLKAQLKKSLNLDMIKDIFFCKGTSFS